MILNSKVNESVVDGALGTQAMGINVANQKKIMSMLTNLYKDPIGSTIREWTSNAIDSHTEAIVGDPVIVSIEQDNSWNWWLKVEDFGVGISPEREAKVVSQFGESTKEHTNTMLGAFGLGLKSGLAYEGVDSFTYRTRHNHVEYLYIMYKGEEGPEISLLSQQPTEERNGTLFTLKIQNKDVAEFITKAKQQLCYFENVYFKGRLDNNFRIYLHDDWKYSSLSSDKNMHLCLDNVYYPIDFNKLGISAIPVPIGLNFKIGEGLMPIPSREDITYTPKVRELIMEKIKKVCTGLIVEYNKTVEAKDDYFDLWNAWGDRSYVIPHVGAMFNISHITKYSDVKPIEPSLKDINLPNLERFYGYLKDSILQEYSFRGHINNGRYFSKETYGDLINDLRQNRTRILIEETPKGVLLDYIKDTYNHSRFVYKVCKRKLFGKYGSSMSYYHLLELKKVPKDKWRTTIQEYQKLEAMLVKRLIDVKSIVPTAEWLKARKDRRAISKKTLVSKEEINPKWPASAERGSGATFRTGPAPIRICDAAKLKCLHVYGLNEDKIKLENIFRMGQGNSRVKGVMLSQRDFDRMEKANLHNWIKISKFMEGNNKPFRVLATMIKLRELKTKFGGVFGRGKFVQSLSKDVYDKMIKVTEYLARNRSSASSDIEAEILLIVDKNNWYDQEMMLLKKELEEVLPKFDFLHILEGSSYNVRPESIKVAVDVLKYRKVKLNLEHYHIPSPPPAIIEVVAELPDTEEEYNEEGEEEFIEVPTEEELDIF